MIQNKRDLGGMQTKDGRMIQPGMLIRSAGLNCAEEVDLRGVSAVLDLRTPGERNEAPDRTYGRIYLPRPIFDDVTAGISHEHGADTQGIPDMALLYRLCISECTAAFRKALLAVMEHDFSTGAILWHCTEGKDRCGIVSALILEMLGVDRESILADYLKTNEVNLPKAVRLRDRIAATHGQAFAERIYQAYIADERYLRAAWDAMGENYPADRLGIPAEKQEAFRRTVLQEGSMYKSGGRS